MEIKKLNIDSLADFKSLIEIFKEVFENEESIANDEQLEKLLSNPDFYVFVVMSNSKVVGGQYGVMADYRGDDFAYYQEKVPGVYFYLGGSNFEKGIVSMPHAPNFQVDETCIRTGVNYFSSLIIERMFN